MHMQTKCPVLVAICTAIDAQFINLLVDSVQDGLSKEEFLCSSVLWFCLTYNISHNWNELRFSQHPNNFHVFTALLTQPDLVLMVV